MDENAKCIQSMEKMHASFNVFIKSHPMLAGFVMCNPNIIFMDSVPLKFHSNAAVAWLTWFKKKVFLNRQN